MPAVGDLAPEFALPDETGAWIHLHGSLPDTEALRTAAPRAIVVPASAGSSSDLEAAFHGDAEWQPELRRIHAGETARLAIDDALVRTDQSSTGNPQSGQ